MKEYVVICRVLSQRKKGTYPSKKTKLFLGVNLSFGVSYKKYYISHVLKNKNLIKTVSRASNLFRIKSRILNKASKDDYPLQMYLALNTITLKVVIS